MGSPFPHCCRNVSLHLFQDEFNCFKAGDQNHTQLFMIKPLPVQYDGILPFLSYLEVLYIIISQNPTCLLLLCDVPYSSQSCCEQLRHAGGFFSLLQFLVDQHSDLQEIHAVSCCVHDLVLLYISSVFNVSSLEGSLAFPSQC